MYDPLKQTTLKNELIDFLNNNSILYEMEDEYGDTLFSCISNNEKLFTIEVCGDYVEFYGDRQHDLINYIDNEYIHKTLNLTLKYFNK